MGDVTLDAIKDLLTQQKHDIVREFNIKFTEMKIELKQVRLIADEAISKTSATQSEVDQLKSDVLALQEANKSMMADLDDQINRSMRSTLIFKGIKDEPNESWENTEQILTEVIVRHLKMNANNVADMLERVHRGKTSSERNGPPYIFAKFYSWKDSEQVKTGFADANRTHPKMQIRVEQMYSKLVTARRNTAMLARKQLLLDGTITNGYLSYPATLMVKKSKTEKQYKRFKSY